MQHVEVAIEVLEHARGLELPTFATAGSAGADVRAAVESELTIPPRGLVLIPTGLRLAIPPGYEIQVRPRSGLAARHKIGLLNSPGTIDSDYRGELQVITMNFGDEPFVVRRGDRIAQLVLASVVRPQWRVVESLDATGRGAGGFGHTGVS